MADAVELEVFPPYKQAVRDFLAEFSYGAVVPHAWLEEHFKMPSVTEGQRMTAGDFRGLQFAWLSSIEAFKADLLREHKVMLVSVRGEGYRWVPPHEQTAAATQDFEREARKVFRQAGQRLRNVRTAELSDEQRRENMDAVAKLSMMRGMQRKALAGPAPAK